MEANHTIFFQSRQDFSTANLGPCIALTVDALFSVISYYFYEDFFQIV